MSNNNITFDDYLKRNIVDKSSPYTHTRIADKEHHISGGLYNIKDQATFMDRYYKHVFIDGNKEYLTEKQKIEDAPLVVDIDMRYSTEVKSRQHTKEHIIDAIDIYAKAISWLFTVPDNFAIEIFIMEKSQVNIMDTKTKDGIHIIFGILMHKAAQVMLRHKILDELKEIWDDLPLTNTANELVDEGVTRGSVNWQMYGSRKPNHKAYLIKHHFNIVWNKEKDNWDIMENNIKDFDTKKEISKLSVSCTSFPSLEINEKNLVEFNKMKDCVHKKKRTTKIVVKENSVLDLNNPSTFSNIRSKKALDELVELMLTSFDINEIDYELKETHYFTMILPKQYYDDGSYDKWIRVGWALKNTSTKKYKLLPTWLKFCSQQKHFDWQSIPELIARWEQFDYNNPDGLTARSIMYWAKNDNFKEYDKVRSETISYYIELTVSRLFY